MSYINPLTSKQHRIKLKAKTLRHTENCSKKQGQKLCTGVSSHKYKDIWVPKDLLRAQGYYEGQTQIWVPKLCPKSQIFKNQKFSYHKSYRSNGDQKKGHNNNKVGSTNATNYEVDTRDSS